MRYHIERVFPKLTDLVIDTIHKEGRYCKMNSTHAPRFLENKDSSEIVVFIHGFMGSPRQFDRIAELTHKGGYNAQIILLPGHGGTLKEFSSSTYRMWRSHLYSELDRLSESYDKIWLVGHSMGGLLALCAGRYPSRKISGIFLISTPMELTFLSKEDIKIRLAQVFLDEDHYVNKEYIGKSSIPRTHSMPFHALAPMVEVRKLMSVTRALLPKVRIPVEAVYSVSDELVSIRSLKILKSGLVHAPLKYTVLVDSLHAYFTDEEKELIDKALLDFLKNPIPMVKAEHSL